MTALTQTSSGFVVAGEIGPAGARRAVTWNLPYGRNQSSSWKEVSPVPASRAAQKITALYIAGNMITAVARQGQAAIATVAELPGS